METTSYSKIRNELRSGDFGLVRASESAISQYIAGKGRSDKSHALLLAWRHADQSTLLVAESREGRGGQVLTLASQVARFPGQIDIYRPKAPCPRILSERAATIAVNWSGRGYSYPGIWRIWLADKPWLRTIAEQAYDLAGVQNPFPIREVVPSPWEEPKICSQLCVWAYRKAKSELFYSLSPEELGFEIVPNLNDRFIEPGDIDRSGALELVAKGLVL